MAIPEQIEKMDLKKAELRHRRAILASRLESLRAGLEEVTANLREIDELLVILEDTTAGLNRINLSAPVSGGVNIGAQLSSEPRRRTTGNPKKEVVAQEVHAYLKAHGKPLSRRELFQKLSDNGFIIRGANPEMVLSTMLWRTADQFGIERLGSGGYALKQWSQRKADSEELIGNADEKSPDIFD